MVVFVRPTFRAGRQVFDFRYPGDAVFCDVPHAGKLSFTPAGAGAAGRIAAFRRMQRGCARRLL
jgi:hypothetical protein